jgi:hypothetical protein
MSGPTTLIGSGSAGIWRITPSSRLIRRRLSRAAEERLAQAGVDLFGRVFSGADAAGIWERARDRLGEVRVEVDADPGAGSGLAWELLRDPARDAVVALAAGHSCGRTCRRPGTRICPSLPGTGCACCW